MGAIPGLVAQRVGTWCGPRPPWSGWTPDREPSPTFSANATLGNSTPWCSLMSTLTTGPTSSPLPSGPAKSAVSNRRRCTHRGDSGRSYFGKDPVLAWHVVESPSEAQIGDLRCSFVATDHGPPTNAVCFEALGPTTGSLGYSADTGPDWAIEQLGTGIGLMLCEATYTRVDEGRYRHLSGRQAGSMAATAAVSRLLLTHRWPSVSASEVLAEAAAAFGGPVVQAAIDATYEW